MYGTDHERPQRTYHVHIGESGRRERVYRKRPSRQVQIRRALAEQTGSRR